MFFYVTYLKYKLFFCKNSRNIFSKHTIQKVLYVFFKVLCTIHWWSNLSDSFWAILGSHFLCFIGWNKHTCLFRADVFSNNQYFIMVLFLSPWNMSSSCSKRRIRPIVWVMGSTLGNQTGCCYWKVFFCHFAKRKLIVNIYCSKFDNHIEIWICMKIWKTIFFQF